MPLLSDVRSELTRAHWMLLILLGAASFFEGYDISIIAVALPDIREAYGLTQSAAAWYLAIIHAGALPAILLSRRADRFGRRQTLLISIVGYTVFTGVTAFAPNVGIFVGLQFVARLFITAEAAVAFAMIAEELPAKTRGFGFGWLASLTAMGTGMAAIVNGAIFAPLDLSWRWLYLVGVPPLILITALRRRLPESTRFTAAAAQGFLAGTWRAILRPPHRRWLVLICLVSAAGTLVTLPVDFIVDFLQTDRGYSESTTNLLLVAAGLPAVLVLSLGGALSDRIGRKIVATTCIALSVVAGSAFFFVDVGLAVTFLLISFTILGLAIANPTVGAFNAELFPTALRSQAGSWAATSRVVGQVLSLGIGSVLLAATGSLPITSVILFSGPVLVIILIAAFFPETKGRELEETAGEYDAGEIDVTDGAGIGPDEEGLEESTTVYPI